MELTDNKELIIKLFCIIILVGLNFAIYFNGKDLSCDQCIIQFSSGQKTQLDKGIEYSFNVSINEIYNGYIKNYCPIKYLENQGFTYANITN
jgi:hypothetical protein